ncbi:MAG: hypothetical protein ABI275_02355 [Terrimesophilobacter sp.]
MAERRRKAEGSWREPASAVPIRWGTYRIRYVAALILILGGAVLVQTGSVYLPQVMLVGMGAHLAGWWILPGRGWRRVTVSLPSLTTVMLILNGAAAMVFLVIPLAGWLWLRHRPLRAYPVLLFPAAAAYLLTLNFAQYGFGAIVLLISGSVVVGSAWLARRIAVAVAVQSDSPASIG